MSINKILALFAAVLCLLYISVAVPGQVVASCGNIDGPMYCEVLAYGWPLPFIADSQSISPVGSVNRNPIWILIGEDNVLWPQLGLSALFWTNVVLVVRAVWRQYKQKFMGKNEVLVDK